MKYKMEKIGNEEIILPEGYKVVDTPEFLIYFDPQGEWLFSCHKHGFLEKVAEGAQDLHEQRLKEAKEKLSV